MTDQLDMFNQDLKGLSEEEAAVYKVIRDHRGREKAIKVDKVAWETSIQSVRVREIVSHLVVRHGKLIGSATGNPPGFYIIEDREELREHIRSLQHRGIMCLVRAAALAKTSIEDIFGQARLEQEEYERTQNAGG